MRITQFPKIVQLKLADFTEEEKKAFRQEYNRKKKSRGIGYLMLFPLGWHYAYVGKWGLQALCILTLWGFLIWWIIDWFRIPSIIANYNKDLAINSMR